MKKEEKLKKLLNEAKITKAFSWLADADSDNYIFIISRRGRTIPRRNVIDVYSVRASINESRGKPIKGFGTLMANLDESEIENVVIHRMMEKNGSEYLLFTDPEIKKLIGVLQLANKNETSSYT